MFREYIDNKNVLKFVSDWKYFSFFFVYSLNFEDADKNNEKGKNINWVRLSSADRDENFPLQLLTSVLVLFFFRKKKKKMR